MSAHTAHSSYTVHSSRFGTLEIEAAAVLSFPRGLIGLGGSRYALLTTDPESPFSWLHSTDDPELALPVMRPFEFFPGYEVVMSDEESESLGIGDDAPADVWVTVRAAASAEDITVNLRAPIIVTAAADGPAAFQVINDMPGLDVRTPLFTAATPAPAGD
jgi:flagellar assembly factor FliW